MSDMHLETQIRIYLEMMEETYTFHVGDLVEINEDYENGYHGVSATIMFPYYYPIDKEQAYITAISPIPFKESELRLISKNPNGEKDTLNFFKKGLEKANDPEILVKYFSLEEIEQKIVNYKKETSSLDALKASRLLKLLEVGG